MVKKFDHKNLNLTTKIKFDHKNDKFDHKNAKFDHLFYRFAVILTENGIQPASQPASLPPACHAQKLAKSSFSL